MKNDPECDKYVITTLLFKDFERYKQDILDLEQKVFEPILCDNEDGLKEALKMKSASCFSIYDKEKMIGVYYLTLLDELDKEFFDRYLLGCWDPTTYDGYDNSDTYYIHIVAIDPSYHGKGMGKKLNDHVMNHLKNNGAKNVLIHAHEGSMLNIIKKSGGVILDKLENLVNTNQDYYLCEIKFI